MIHSDLHGWLDDESAVKCVLVEVYGRVGNSEVLHYFSSMGYVTTPTCSPANQVYLPYIDSIGTLTETLSQNGKPSISLGELSLNNSEGNLDELMDTIWTNRDVRVFIGDVSWPRSQFRMIYRGVVDDLVVKNRTEIAFRIMDRLQALNNPISEELLTDKDNALVPLCFGEVCNVSPTLISESLLRYKLHTRNVSQIVEVRDKGAPVNFTPNHTDGTFTLSAKPFGQVTCSVKGDSVGGFTDRPAQLITRIATQFGNARTRFTSADLDTTNINQFDTAHPQCVGIYLDSRTNTLDVMSQLADSVGAAVTVSKEGKLRLHKIQAPQGTPVIEIDEFDMVENSFTVKTRISVVASHKLAYNRNWTPQTDLATGIPESHRDQWEEDWKYVIAKDQSVADIYRLFDEPEAIQTLMQIRSEAQFEANRLTDLFKVQRYIYSFQTFPKLLTLELADVVRLRHPRFGAEGKLGMVIGMRSDWVKGTATVEVFV